LTYRSLGAWATAGAALWCSLGVLDVTDSPAGITRLAMLPGLTQLAGSVALALLLGLVIGLPRSTAATASDDTVLPLYGLAALILPYLPWLPDFMPVLWVFAGPGKYLLWAIVVAQVIWSALGVGSGRRVAASLQHSAGWRAFGLVGVVSLVLVAGASRAVLPSGLFPGVEEAHYLVTAQRLSTHHDLDTSASYRSREYAAFTPRELKPRLVGRGDVPAGQTAMPLGVPVLVSPAFGAAGYPGSVLLLNLIAALASATLWLWIRRVSGSVSAATFGWAATALTLPAVVLGGTVSPDTPAALLLLAAAGALWPGAIDQPGAHARPAESSPLGALRIGAVAAALPWFHPVYLGAAVVLAGLGLWRIARQAFREVSVRTWYALALLALPLAVSVAAWAATYGRVGAAAWFWLPIADTPAAVPLPLLGRHLLTLVADQEYGVLATAPALAIAVIGLWTMWRRGGTSRSTAIELALLVAAVAVPAALYHAAEGGPGFPGQYVIPAVLLAALPIAFEYRRAGQYPERRAIYRLLLLMGLGATVAAIAVKGGALLDFQRDGISPLIAWLSPDWPLSSYAPEFLTQPAWTGLLETLVWLAAVAGCTSLVSWFAGRSGTMAGTSRIGRGLAFTRASVGALLAILLATGLVRVLLGSSFKPGLEPRDRGRIEMLDRFDPYARPFAVRFDPWTRLEAGTVPQLFELSARPVAGSAADAADTPFNAQFALPAGRYRVQLMARAAASDADLLSGRLGLQAGTWGGSMIEWEVEGADSRQWTNSFDLPADMGLVTFAAHGSLGRQVKELRVIPYRVVPFLDRIAADDVRAAATYDRLLFLFQDTNGYPDRDGFWIRGGSPARVSVVSRTGRLITELRLVLRSRFANRVRIEMPDRVWTEDLGADEEREISVKPTSLDGTVRMVLTAEHGFYPIDTDRGSTDRRYLGCFVRILE